MPGITVPVRRQRLDDSDGEEEDVSRDGTPLSRGTNTSKRARLDLDSDDGDEDASQVSTGPAYTNGNLPNGASAPESHEEYIVGEDAEGKTHPPGSIVRVKLTNFVTYTSAEFFPGPKMNMIIGPNGTGKSTLVCAICLGLGFGTSFLGRAKDISEFVKHGSAEAEIEIELARNLKVSRHNFVIRRSMKREGNKSGFWINGKLSNKNKVAELCQRLSIQVDNLCQFLPQEKVADFARMDPVMLLRETQRAVGRPEMLGWHQNLKDLRKEQKRLQIETKVNKEELELNQKRQELAQEDVKRVQEREQIQKRVRLLEKCRPIPRYKEAHARSKELGKKRQAAKEACDALKRSVEPALRAVNAKQQYRQEVELEMSKRKKKVEKLERDANSRRDEINAFTDKTKELEHEGEQEKKRQKDRKEEERRIQRSIDHIKNQMRNEPVEFDAAAFNEKIREKVRMLEDLKTQGDECTAAKRKHMADRDAKAAQIKEAQRELERLDSQAGQQEIKLRTFSRDSAEAWKWIRNNPDKFEFEVFGPPMVVCSVKDPKYTDALESLFQKNDFLAFTVQSMKDFRTLQAQLSSVMKLHETTIKMCSTPFETASRRPQGMESFDLRAHGFDGWALDYISGPEQVLAMLCAEQRLHTTPTRLRELSNPEFDSLIATNLGNWVAGRSSYTVKRRREYGPSAQSTLVKPVNAARVWTNSPVDVSAKRDLQDNIQGWTEEHEAIVEQLKVAEALFKDLKPRYIEIQKEQKSLQDEKNDRQTAVTQFRALPTKLEQVESRLEKHLEAAEGTREHLKEIVRKLDENSLKKAKATLAYAAAVEALRVGYEEYIESEVRLIEAVSDVETLTANNAEISNRLKAKQAEAETAAKESAEAGASARLIAKEVGRIANEANNDEDLQAVATEVSNGVASEKLEADIESAYANLEIIQGGQQGNVIRDFENRQKLIEKLTDKIETATGELEEIAHGIAEIREKWEPELDTLAVKISDGFSHNMASIGCAGQISIYKADDEPDDNDEENSSDYEKWGVHIRVKFREHESLQLLTAHRQSGGERSVSTIFYLMALQSLSASPFRVVDEINQGMDPRNERKVHERMVDIACNQGGSQYFLITPKLLTNLKYKRGMSVHCIVSGEFMPQDQGSLDFRKCVEIGRRIKVGRGVGVGA